MVTVQSVTGSRELRFDHQTGVGWDAYSGSAKGTNDQWVTVQIVSATAKPFVVKIFDPVTGKMTAGATMAEGDKCLKISRIDKEKGDDAVIKGALLAVTGEDVCVESN